MSTRLASDLDDIWGRANRSFLPALTHRLLVHRMPVLAIGESLPASLFDNDWRETRNGEYKSMGSDSIDLPGWAISFRLSSSPEMDDSMAR